MNVGIKRSLWLNAQTNRVKFMDEKLITAQLKSHYLSIQCNYIFHYPRVKCLPKDFGRERLRTHSMRVQFCVLVLMGNCGD